MITKQGIHSKTDGNRYTLMYNGQEVCDKMFGGIVRSGLYVNGDCLKLYGNVIAQSPKTDPALVEASESIVFGDTDLITSGKCINISLNDYNKLLAGEEVDGYKAYSPDDVYNVIPDGSTAEDLTYTISNGVYTFSNGATASVDNNIIYNNVSALSANTEDLTETVLNTDCPQIYVRYFNPIIPVGGSIELEYHVDDRFMSAINYDKVEDTFTTIVKTASGNTVSKTTYAGTFKLTTPTFSTAGQTWFSIRCIDSNGVASEEQYFDILVRDSVTEKLYVMQESDLTAYGIVPDNRNPIIAKANKSALSNFFAAVKADEAGYTGVKMLNRTYWIDYHNTFGTQTYYQCTIANNKISSVVGTVTEDYITTNRIYTKFIDRVPYVGFTFNEDNGTYYLVRNTSTNNSYITFPNWFTVDLNGATLRATQCTDLSQGFIVLLNNNIGTHIRNGNLRGNYTDNGKGGTDFDLYLSRVRAGKSSEWIGVCSMQASKYCSFENLNVSDSVGYDCFFSALNTNGGIKAESIGMTDGKRIDLTDGSIINAEDMVVTGSYSVGQNQLIAFGRNGYQKYLNMGTQRELFFSFYDSNGDYIKTIKGHAYRLLRTPEGTASLRITGYGKIKAANESNSKDWAFDTTNGDLFLFHPSLCTNVEIKNCHWKHTRTTAFTNPAAYGCLVENCTFENIAVEKTWEVTAAMGDIEDSWQWANNLKIHGCSCTKGRGYDDIIIHYVKGFEFSNNTGISFTDYGGIESGYIHDNVFPSIYMERNRSCYHPFVVYDNNTINSLEISYGTWKHKAVTWTIAQAEKVVSMMNSVITNKCRYGKLKLRNCKNGEDVIN